MVHIMALIDIMVIYLKETFHLETLLIFNFLMMLDTKNVENVGHYFVVMKYGMIIMMLVVIIIWTLFILLI